MKPTRKPSARRAVKPAPKAKLNPRLAAQHQPRPADYRDTIKVLWNGGLHFDREVVLTPRLRLPCRVFQHREVCVCSCRNLVSQCFGIDLEIEGAVYRTNDLDAYPCVARVSYRETPPHCDVLLYMHLALQRPFLYFRGPIDSPFADMSPQERFGPGHGIVPLTVEQALLWLQTATRPDEWGFLNAPFVRCFLPLLQPGECQAPAA